MANEEANPIATDHERQLYELYYYKYDVYLSFAGEDTGANFTGDLRDVLSGKGFNIFTDPDGDGIGKAVGSYISLDLLKALEGCRISIVVFSENFAFSEWRLDELVQMLECRKATNQRIFPIFYRVDPSDVRRQRGSFGEAMARHQHKFGKDSVIPQIWMSALSEITDLVGYNLAPRPKDYSQLMDSIVKTVARALPRTYDVFLSFYGDDTRHSFTGFLYRALRQKGVKAFMDDEGLVSGKQVQESLLRAIERSMCSIVIISENYGYSSWCLDELVKIVECKENRRQRVLPIFYKTEPYDVGDQTKSYGEAMTKHEERFGKDSEKVQKWRSALSKVASLKEYVHITGNEYEYKIIEKIVDNF